MFPGEYSVTRVKRFSVHVALVAFLAAVLAWTAGCGREVEPFPEPGGTSEKEEILRRSGVGPVVVSFASYPLRPGAPPDGVQMAILQAIGNGRCDVASFYWSERALSMGWIQEQMEHRRRTGQPLRLIMAGHGLGATEAAEVAREIIFNDRDVQIVLLLTVDAVKTGRLASPAGVAGNTIAKRIPGVNHSFTAYDAAPVPDGRQLWSHINYYQTRSTYYHGAAMPGAENHHLDDWTGLLNHGNADDFAVTFLVNDLRYALRKAVGR